MQEKVACFKQLGIDPKLPPKRIYAARANGRIRYFHIKMPVAVEGAPAIVAYIDPGMSTRIPAPLLGPSPRDGTTISASGGKGGGQGHMNIDRHFQYSHESFIKSAGNRLFLRGRSTRRCGLVLSGKALEDAGFPASSSLKRRGCAPRVPCPLGGDRAARKVEKVEGAPPLFTPSRTARGRGTIFMVIFILFPCLWGSLPPQ